MFVSINKLANQLPKDKPDNRAENALQEGLGGQFGDTYNDAISIVVLPQIKVLCCILISMADEIENTFDKLKVGAKAIAKKVTDPDKDLGNEYDKERGKETSIDYQ
jgi:hypothetical protein